jgi:hypothetical protein
MTANLKLSDAMELGWEIAPQSWDYGYGLRTFEGEWKGACAVGAAILGAKPEAGNADLFLHRGVELFPDLLVPVADSQLPAGFEDYPRDADYDHLILSDVVQYLNDDLHRPAAEIVTYVRQLGY